MCVSSLDAGVLALHSLTAQGFQLLSTETYSSVCKYISVNRKRYYSYKELNYDINPVKAYCIILHNQHDENLKNLMHTIYCML